MTGPDDAFLAPDDALRELPEDAGPGAADVERPGESVPPREDEAEDRSGGSVEDDAGGTGGSVEG
jgi:hypothetical protein